MSWLGCRSKFVRARANSHNNGGDFDHLVAYSMACTLESVKVCVMEYGTISFGSLDEVIDVDDLESIGQGMKCLDQGKDRGKWCTTKTAP